MNIALVGYGKMGKLIEAKALEGGHRITAVIDPFLAAGGPAAGRPVFRDCREEGALDQADLAIEFTQPRATPENIAALAERKIPAVIGTTGWYDQLDRVKTLVTEAGSSLVWAANFSLGVNLFYRIAARAAKMADPFPEYDVGGWEAHHNKKADSPSGTAKTLTERVLSQMTRKTRVLWDTLEGPPAPEVLHYPSLRIGSAPGVHTLIFDSPADTITLTHEARNREGFAVGALRAAEWLLSRGPAARRGVFTMDDVLDGILMTRG
ncbi:MAG: 4-hydroxy-tetrahydrodipicolinate reductase [Spirochaetaceae bacterium]|jgi:4-hydroxy-tetrahydrodipicolinate reductase|nr:4-hydroxy-tetrahydrodipicolinate reductase [Spirochaetaceae bacterium]